MNDHLPPRLSPEKAERIGAFLAREYIAHTESPKDWELLDRHPELSLPDKTYAGVSPVGIPAPLLQRILAVCRAPEGPGLLSMPALQYDKPDAGLDLLQFHSEEELRRFFLQQKGIDQMQRNIHDRAGAFARRVWELVGIDVEGEG